MMPLLVQLVCLSHSILLCLFPYAYFYLYTHRVNRDSQAEMVLQDLQAQLGPLA